VSYPLPGTPFYERVKAQLGEKQNWVDSDDLAMMYRATYVPEFYRNLHATVHAEFRARKGLEALTRLVRRPWSCGPRTARAAIAGVYHSVALPFLRRRSTRLAEKPQASPPIVLSPVLSPQAAARPSEQPR
jgi:hypothetical protein